ncbi:MAG: 4-(cytidine 5'-diphospho)-2-C-methyl-D-erythritol kinase [Deltaproteobacteria bacterium]|nr:4-(cytidine 5'-diphospho)-2-C-methyl-D-erythritol kinase [Deltaproteobacteria bacterium]
MEILKLSSPAKINLRLKVLGQRPDRYHDLSMIMTRVSLADEIQLEKTSAGVELISESQELPADRTNLAYRAAELFFQKTGCPGGIKIILRKNIPVAAGLGGGSSNAATVIKGLAQLYDVSLEDSSWIEETKKLGADIPFFMKEGPQIAEGVGERLTPLKNLPKLSLILVNPGFPVSTREVFEAYSSPLTGTGKVASLPPHLGDSPFGSLEDLLPFLENDLEKVVLDRYPVVGEIKKELSKRGAAASLMSGSGPTVFAVFRDEEGRDRALRLFEEKRPPAWKVFPVEVAF